MLSRGVVRAAIASGVVAYALALAAAPAQAVEREIYVENACSHPVRLVVSHAPVEDSWDPHGWYEFAPNEEAIQLLDDNDVPLTQLDDHALFIYGESTDGSDIYWEGEEYYETFSEVTYGMQRAQMTVVGGDFSVRLVCDEAEGE